MDESGVTSPPAAVAQARGPLARLIGKAPWGVADQAMISASNLATTVLLIRALGADGFGEYAMVFSGLLIANSVQQGLITGPHNILGPSMRGEAYRRYTLSAACAQIALSLLLAAGVLVAAGVVVAMGGAGAALLLILAPTTVTWQLREFARRVLYTDDRVAAAFLNDFVAYAGQAIVIGAMAWLGGLTPERALAVVGLTNAVGAVLGLVQLRGSFAWPVSWRDLRETWRIGKWMAGTELAGTWMCDGTLFYFAAAVAGPVAAGVLQGVHTLFGPVRIFVQALHVMLPIRLARTLAEGGDTAMRAHTRVMLRLAAPAFGLFSLALIAAAGPVLTLVFGEEWAEHASVLRLYAAVMFLGYVATIFASALKAKLATRLVFTNRVAAGLVGLPVGCVLTLVMGIHGAVLGMLVNAAVLLALYHAAYRRLEPADAAPQPQPRQAMEAAA